MNKSITTKIMNWVLYGNEEGTPNHKGKVCHEYDEFLKEVFNYKVKENQNENIK